MYSVCIYTLIKFVGYYDFIFYSVHVSLDGGCVGGVSSIQVLFWIFGIILTLQSPLYPVSLASEAPTMFPLASGIACRDQRCVEGPWRGAVCHRSHRRLHRGPH